MLLHPAVAEYPCDSDREVGRFELVRQGKSAVLDGGQKLINMVSDDPEWIYRCRFKISALTSILYDYEGHNSRLGKHPHPDFSPIGSTSFPLDPD